MLSSSSSSFLTTILQKYLKSPPLSSSSSSSKTILSKSLTSLLLSLPIVVWINDKLYTTATIQGSSMEPTLYEGDVVLIRRADFGLGVRQFYQKVVSYFNSSSTDQNEEEEEYSIQEEQIKITKMDATVGKFPSGWISSPPLLLGGDVVVYKDGGFAFPDRWNVKRVVGLGGQRVRPSKEYRTFQSIPNYSLWVEGDNRNNSEDSNETGPISKKSIVGVAECIIWPPSRAWGGDDSNNGGGGSRFSREIERIRPLPGRAWWA